MKPRIFVGSSVEGLSLAYAVQDNLNYDAEVTVWTQGIFQLSSTTLEDLFNALERFDFGIFIFKPDDVVHMREYQANVVRDNVIFELGLFFGKLGRDRVFFVQPDVTEDFHLPTDLLGLMAGTYNVRDDGNLQAALGPFCNQVRIHLKRFVYESLIDLTNESKEAKIIALEKKRCWEMLLSAALLKSRMKEIKRSFDEIQKGHVFRKAHSLSIKQFGKWYPLASNDFLRMFDIGKDIYLYELEKSWGEKGVAGDVIEIKRVVDKIENICRELLSWEIDLQTINAPDELSEIPKLLKGWSGLIINEFARLPDLLEKGFSEENIALGKLVEINLTFKEPPNIKKITEIIHSVTEKVLRGELDYE